MQSDADIVREALAGRQAAFGELVRRHARRAYAFAYRLSGDRDVAEDAVQEAFVKAWKSLGAYDLSREFRPWLFAIVRNATYDLLRKRRDAALSDVYEDDESLAAEDDGAAASFDARIAEGVLEEALRELSFDQRNAVYLHDVEGRTFEQISSLTGRPLNTEKSHYRRAILALRKILAHRGFRG
ncbi:MAG TPA: RNA polymerase sigma factor [Candidatus Paceibacterota bacterium]|nr:RNA polymerase sigma factor [Candidatus Paceibacterota bacterium]